MTELLLSRESDWKDNDDSVDNLTFEHWLFPHFADSNSLKLFFTLLSSSFALTIHLMAMELEAKEEILVISNDDELF